MKKLRLQLLGLIAAIVALTAFSERTNAGGSIRGTVSPAEGGWKACIIDRADTMEVSIVSGTYELSGLRPGQYALLIKTTERFKPAGRSNIMVQEGEITYVDEIKLEPR